MKVVLINPPQTNSLDDHLDPPLGLMYIASSLEEQNIDVSICDLSSKPQEEWLSSISPADIYGMTLFSASFNSAREIAKIIKERDGASLVVAGGPHATSLPEETMSHGRFDRVIVGEGEVEFPKLVKDFEDGKTIPKIIYAKPISDIDNLPFPARHLVDLLDYHREVEGKKVTSVVTSRGCPYNCNFCCKDVHGRRIRFRSVDNVVRELKEVIEHYGIKSFIFYDDIFTLKRERLLKLCENLKELNITFRCNGRTGINTLEDYMKLREAGCEEIAFGIESGSQKMLDMINKGSTVENNFQAITLAKQAGLITKAYLVVGFPGESQETVDETKTFMVRTNPDKYTVFAFVPLPGCDVWKNPGRYGIVEISRDWNQFFNIAGNYEGGYPFRTNDLDPSTIKLLHDDLVNFLLTRKENYGQTGKLQQYYQKLERR